MLPAPTASPHCACAQLQEGDIIERLEKMCNPDSEQGEWLNQLDIQEEGDKLKLVDMGQVSDSGQRHTWGGSTGRRCTTGRRACLGRTGSSGQSVGQSGDAGSCRPRAVPRPTRNV